MFRTASSRIVSTETISSEARLEKSPFSAQSLFFAGGFVLLLLLAGWMIVSQLTSESSSDAQSMAEQTFIDETGIRIVRVVLAAVGGMIDIHYQVVDPDKGLVVHDDENPPTIIIDKSDYRLNFEFHEHSFDELVTARVYRLHIMNTDNLVQRGDTISISVGESQLDNIIVQ